jgi:hypothetical protein
MSRDFSALVVGEGEADGLFERQVLGGARGGDEEEGEGCREGGEDGQSFRRHIPC